MDVHTWQLRSWPECPLHVPEELSNWIEFRHVRTWIHTGSAHAEIPFLRGETIWFGSHAQQQVCLAWEWNELRSGVFCISVPNTIVSNIKFLDAHGNPEREEAAIISATRLLHGLQWQQVVADQVNTARKGSAIP